MKLFLLLCSIICGTSVLSQTRQAVISGVVTNDINTGIADVTISILGKKKNYSTTDSGKFSITIPSGQSLALIFSHAGFTSVQRNFYLNEGETEYVYIKLKDAATTLQTVEIGTDKTRQEVGAVSIDPTTSITLPSTTGGVEALIKTIVGSNNELTSQYNVRGGNFDENLIYINDFEVFRPYLVSSGQQEGLSLINPALAKNVTFYTGGFQALYGDKMSSVLDIQYKKPTALKGSAYVSLLEQGFHVEGSSKNKPVTFLLGVRNKNNRNLLSNQPTLGSYLPSASDVQGYITYKLSNRWSLEMLGIYSRSSFDYEPESVKKTSAVFSPFFTSQLGLDINFEGREKDKYVSSLLGGTIVYTPTNRLKLKLLLSRFNDNEAENFDIAGAYLFGERDFDNSSSTFGQITNPLGAGYYQTYGRNSLNIKNITAAHKGTLQLKKHFILWGTSIEHTSINDKLSQFEYQDSAGYSLPYQPSALSVFSVQNSNTNLEINKYSGYIQDNYSIRTTGADYALQGGIRFNYNSLNNELLVSPRIQASVKPSNWVKDILFKFAAGIYNQPPFYRELRNYQGFVNTSIRAQKSIQFVAGADYKFVTATNSPLRITSEFYFKKMHDVVPYDIDNVKIRYLGSNNAKAYTAGAEFRLYTELTKDAQSWVSLGIMRSREDIDNDFFYNYLNSSGEIITAATQDQVPTDSIKQNVGYVRRPSDRLITMGIYLEDYLATNKNFKVYLNMIYGSNMSYNIPGSTKFRNGLIIEPYIRADLGFSALLLSEKNNRRSHSPFKGFDNIWASLEVFNIIDRANTISYQLIKDFSNTTYAIPNRLTPRLLNIKLLARF